MDFNKLKRKYNTDNRRKLLLLLRKNGENGLSYRNIEEVIPNKSGNTGKLITPLKKDNLLNIEVVNHSRRGVRKKFSLNSLGQELGDQIVFSGLNDDEIKLINFLKEMRNFRNTHLTNDFWDIINQFYEYGFNEHAILFSEMIQSYLIQIRKFFRYETQFNPELSTEQDIIQE